MSNLEKIGTPSSSAGFNLGLEHQQSFFMPRGEFHLQLVDDDSGKILEEWVRPNTLTADASIYAAWLFASVLGKAPLKGSTTRPVATGLNGLALGTGLVSDPKTTRNLKTEVARVGVETIEFKTATNSAGSIIATNILDYTFKIGADVASGQPLQEMGLVFMKDPTKVGNIATISPKPVYPSSTSSDIRDCDILINYLSFGVITKPQNSTLTITWRLTF